MSFRFNCYSAQRFPCSAASLRSASNYSPGPRFIFSPPFLSHKYWTWPPTWSQSPTTVFLSAHCDPASLMNSPDCDTMSLSNSDPHSGQAASSSNVQHTTFFSTHPESNQHLGVIEITNNGESNPSDLLAIKRRLDKISKVSKSTILSWTCILFWYQFDRRALRVHGPGKQLSKILETWLMKFIFWMQPRCNNLFTLIQFYWYAQYLWRVFFTNKLARPAFHSS